MKSYIYVVIGILLVLKDANGTINLTATPYLQTFVSHDTYGVSNYPDGNYSRDWLITGETANYTITIEFQACALETGNNKGVCIDDKVYVYDGSNSSASLLLDTCCGPFDTPSPYPFVYSTDGTMYIRFSTDSTLSNNGFLISYILQDAPTSTVSITTVQVAASTPKDNTLLYIIIACAITALLVIIIIILICIVCCKKKSKAKKTKRKGHKKFGRSAPKPVVVTSESGSEAELVGDSESPRVVQTQQHSPPPAYATVVKDQNQNTIAQQKKENSKQNNPAHYNNDKKKNSGKNSNVEKENSTKVKKENSSNQNNELDIPTKKEEKASSESKIKKSKKKGEISKEKKTVPTEIETGKNPVNQTEKEATSTRTSDIDKENEQTNTKLEVTNERNVKSQIKDLDTSPDKKDIETTTNKNIERTSHKKDIETTPIKKNIENTPDKKDIETTSNKKNIETTQKKKNIETASDKKDMETTPNKKNIEKTSDKKDIETTPNKKNIETSPDKKDIKTTPNKKNIETTSDKKDIETTPNKKNIETSPDKKDIKTKPNKKNIETTSDKKDTETTPNKKNIETTSDKKDIETTPDKKVIETTPNKMNIDTTTDKIDTETTPDKKEKCKEEGKVQKGKTENRILDKQHVDKIKNDKQNSEISKSEKTIHQPHELGIIYLEATTKPAIKTEQMCAKDNRETKNTISPISNKQNEETLKTDEKEDKNVETNTKKNQQEIQSHKTKDKDKNNNSAEVHKKTLTYCEKQSVLTKSESRHDLFENENSFLMENVTSSNKSPQHNDDTIPSNYIAIKSKGIPHQSNVTSIDNSLEGKLEDDQPYIQKSNNEHRDIRSGNNASRPDKASKMIFNNTFFESLNKKPPKQTRRKQERKVIHSKNSVVPLESIENDISDQVSEESKMETKKNQSDKNNQNDDKRVINLTPEKLKESGDNETENKPILSKSAPSILNFGTSSEQAKGSTNSTSDRFDDNSSIFTISSGATSNFKKSKERKRFSLSVKQYVPENKTSQPKLNEENYEERIENLKNIYHSHSKHGRNDRNIARARTQIDFEMHHKPTVKENPWLVQPKKDGFEIKGNQQVTKATVLRRMRTMGVEELEDESIPDRIPRTQAFDILRMRTTLCDEDLAKSRHQVLPPLRGIPRQEPPDLPNLWRP